MISPPVLGERTCGILLHPTSLPGVHGSGDLGKEARTFVDWLAQAGQGFWQMLPIVPPAAGNSPYQSVSAFAGSPWLISLQYLVELGLLEESEIQPLASFDSSKVDFEQVLPYREERLRKAAIRFLQRTELHQEFNQFCAKEAFWLNDYALFCSIKSAMGNQAWTAWPAHLRDRHPTVMAQARSIYLSEIRYHQFVQFMFARQWDELRAYAKQRGVALMGDMPIFVAHDSADVWARRSEYYLEENGEPTVVAGVPPDIFSETGQRWGNALYKWDIHAETGFSWWVERFRSLFAKFDALRIDHFIGFYRFWAIPASSPIATHGQFLPGPRDELFQQVKLRLGPIPIVAEDLGLLIAPVTALRKRLGFPGMKVLQFSFPTDVGAKQEHPHAIESNCVVYTGTHDNNTTLGWFSQLQKDANHQPAAALERDYILNYLNCQASEIVGALIREAYRSPATTCIIPLQDVLELGEEARMNMPSVATGNWGYRFQSHEITQENAQKLRRLADIYDRRGWPAKAPPPAEEESTQE
jgi:4-alpha-glucanotransferase